MKKEHRHSQHAGASAGASAGVPAGASAGVWLAKVTAPLGVA
jgi:hypothetical protein